MAQESALLTRQAWRWSWAYNELPWRKKHHTEALTENYPGAVGPIVLFEHAELIA